MRALLAAVVALLVGRVRPPAPPTNPWIEKTPLDIAHQGGEDEFPSNTMYAFERSLQVGADMLELDVGVTKDGQVVVMHDTTVDRTTNGHGTVASFTLQPAAQARRRVLVLGRRRRLPPRPRALGLSPARRGDRQAQAAQGLHRRRLPRARR